MIGSWAVLDESLFMGIPLLVLVIMSLILWRSKGVGMSVRVKLAMGVFFLLFLVATLRFARQFREHWQLSGLRRDQIAAIDVGGKAYTSAEAVSNIAQALNESQWFTSSHGGWAKEIPLTIRFRSRQERQYRIALYLKEQGAVIIFFSRHKGGGESRDGYAFSKSLPAVLAAAGTPLPSEIER